LVNDVGLEHTVCEKRPRELDLFGLYQRRVGEFNIAVFSDLMGGCRREGVGPFSQVHRNRRRSNRDKLPHRKF